MSFSSDCFISLFAKLIVVGPLAFLNTLLLYLLVTKLGVIAGWPVFLWCLWMCGWVAILFVGPAEA